MIGSAGPWPVQLRYQTGQTGEQYVTARGWLDARLESCPLHPHGGCSLARHGTYERKTPPGARVARWYCPEGHTTFGLLPDCLAARLPGTLDVLEAVVVAAEEARSLEAAANALRPDGVELPGAMRWVRRRVRLIHGVLVLVVGLLPDRLAGCPATMAAVRTCLASDRALMDLRHLVAGQLAVLPAPLGFQGGGTGVGDRIGVFQHPMGPDPPPAGA